MTKKELLDLLDSIEWAQPTYNGSPSCPCCGHQRHWKHARDCALAKAIKSQEIEEEEYLP